MKTSNTMKTGFQLSTLASALALAMGTASAADVYLAAKPFEFGVDLPLSGVGAEENVPMWGYVLDAGGTCYNATDNAARLACINGLGDPTLPGPRLSVPPGDPALTVYLSNGLSVPTSMVMPGQALPASGGSGPTWDDDSTGGRTNADQKVRSYGAEAAGGGGRESYAFTLDRPGSYIYHSGTWPQLQVYMGLYGAVTQDAAAGEAYAGVPYDNEVILFYSDVDPVHNNAVDPDSPLYDPLYTPIHYNAKWFLINGEPYEVGMGNIPAGSAVTDANDTRPNTLLRLLSAASETHVPTLQGLYMSIHAEDGFRYEYQNGTAFGDYAPREQYSAMLPPLKTKDAIVVAEAEGRYAVYDGNGYMTTPSNPNDFDQGDELGGMLRFLSFSANEAPVAVADAATTPEDTPVVIDVLDNDTDPNPGDVLTIVAVTQGSIGSVTISDPACCVLYTPNPDMNGLDMFDYTVADSTGATSTATAVVDVTVTAVNDPPVLAAIGNQSVDEGTALTFTATASDPDVGDTLSFSLDAGAPAGASIDSNSGGFSWTPSENQGPGTYPVTVRVTDDGTPSLDDSETISITVNEVNEAPLLAAIGDQAVDEGNELTFTATASDPDLPANALTFTLDAGAPAGAAIDPSTGVFSWTTSAADGPGTYPVTVRVTDDGTPSLDDAETIAITVNEPTVAPVLLYLSLSGNGTLTGLGPNGSDLTYANEDILSWNGTNYAMVFDGSAAGVAAAADVRGFDIDEANSRILLTFLAPGNVGGVAYDDSDIVAYDTSGSGNFSLFFDGSDVGLTTNGEDLDAVHRLPDGRLLVSTLNGYTVPGGVSGNDEDLIAFTPTSLGATTAGTWALYFDGSDVGLNTNNGEDVNAASVAANGDIYLSTLNAFTVGGGALSGQDEDVFVCEMPTTGANTACGGYSTFFDGTPNGLGGVDEVDAIDLP